MTPPVTALVTSTSPHMALAASPLLSHCRRMSALPLPAASFTGRLMLTRFRPKTTSGLPGRRIPCTWWIFTSRTYLPTVFFATSILTRTWPSLWTFRFLRVRVISLNSPVTTCSRIERVKLVGIPIITPPRGALATLFSPLATINSREPSSAGRRAARAAPGAPPRSGAEAAGTAAFSGRRRRRRPRRASRARTSAMRFMGRPSSPAAR